jgi:hypothetical protein
MRYARRGDEIGLVQGVEAADGEAGAARDGVEPAHLCVAVEEVGHALSKGELWEYVG